MNETTEQESDPEARIAALEAENQRLREEYRRATQAKYRNAARVLAALGVIAVLFSLVLPGSRNVLLALAGAGLFTGVLVYYLTPERLLAASVSEHLVSTYGRNLDAAIGELGLQQEFVYIPRADYADVRLFVPHKSNYQIPDDVDLQERFVVTNRETERGLAMQPVGEAILSDVTDYPATSENSPRDFATTLTEILVEVLEIVDTVDIQGEEEKLILTYDGGMAQQSEYPDNPLMSIIGAGLASHIEEPVTIVTEEKQNSLVCSWSTEKQG